MSANAAAAAAAASSSDDMTKAGFEGPFFPGVPEKIRYVVVSCYVLYT